jgi:dTDP-4-amino-4,6-dideoxygalactose transaminase
MNSTSGRSGRHSLQDWPGTRYMDETEIAAVTRVLTARSPFRYYGPDLQNEASQFEAELSQFIGSRFCVGVSSGTTALQAALAALNVGPGDEVILPGYFWVSTVAAIVNNGAVPVLADVDDSFSLDPDDLERKLTARTKAVVVVHMGGVIGQIERICDICKARSIPLLEDCAQAIGASKDGVKAGCFGDMGIFSFQMNKTCTAGEGGAIVTSQEELFKKVVAIHDLGYPRDASGNLVLDDEARQLWGIGCRMSELTAAVLRVQVRRLPVLIEEMRSIKTALIDVVSPYGGVRCATGDDSGGDPGTSLLLVFESDRHARSFQQLLFACAMRQSKHILRSTRLADYGLHVYYKNKSLVNKKSICGHHSVWELTENSFAKQYSYEKGTLPSLDGLVHRTLLFATPVGLTSAERDDLREIFRRTCEHSMPSG